MAKPHFLIRRSRSGRFNFTLLSTHGRITGVVNVATTDRTKGEIEQEAREKIRALAGVLGHVISADDDPDAEPGPVCREVYN